MCKIILAFLMVSLVGCGAANVKPQKATLGGRLPLSSLMLSKANKQSHYGVLLGVYLNNAQAQQMVSLSLRELVKVGVKNPVVVALPMVDAKNTKVVAVIAGQYKLLANAHYLQRILTRVVPGQYNLITVPNVISK